ncbi:DUF6879 family protein [Nocardia sp. NPDC056000]|uniref:DUF6879 family protein n=1 Tax=Nocardia sp. NPDC056000 TaxID=3345674 RepID=UPI0035DCB3E1
MLFIPAGPEFDQLFHDAHTRAFHLETQDSYGQVAEEVAMMERFLAGEPYEYPPNWDQWFQMIKSTTARGVAVQRVRVVTEPHGDYTRFALDYTSRFNQPSGEDIRWLPRQSVDAAELTPDDWWLFDNDIALFTMFTSTGDFAGGGHTTDADIVARCVRVRDRLWERAIPHDRYVAAT